MRPPNQLVYSRARVRQRYAMLPLEGFPTSRLPSFPDAEARVLAAPALGAGFVQYLIDLPAGKQGAFQGDDRLETFYYALSGDGEVRGHGAVREGGFGLLPPGASLGIRAGAKLRLIVLRKAYERAPGIEMFQPLHGSASTVKAEVWADNPHSRLQTLIPDDLRYDLAMNIFTFDPGHGLPYVETHVMEHGLLVLQGKGMYYLDGEWMEVESDDFIWMGPYCPQSFYATGPTPARYLYYKNVNREIAV
ncbi:MAG TPA: (S)-ureidoglycine aminohydrolase [Tepidisphaeraceae bacterium]|nr:(S)-ureidoglycine aminohydrolase [Tepidisphaeraceae bacterium]